MKIYFLKSIAVYLTVNILTIAVAPTISFALTSGPTAPEFSSFEPVDTTDMVNIATGDLTYNLPLLEVPGPEGGYPISMAYHAGISPDDESSWCGLGWNINAGSINRFVNGIPDDMNGSEELIRDLWEGGETRTTSFGIGLGLLGGSMGMGGGFTMANDTYKGSSIGADFNIGLSAGGGIGVGIQGGFRPFGGSNLGVGISLGSGGSAVGGSISVGATITSDNEGSKISAFGGGGMGVGYGGKGSSNRLSIVGASISTSASQPSFQQLGLSVNSVNDRVGNNTVISSNQNFNVPIWWGINLSFGSSYTRYYLDVIDGNKVFGTLYGKNIPADLSKITYDCYSLKTPTSSYTSNADLEAGGSLPAYDSYQVLGQGIGGAIHPYVFEPGSLFRRVAKDKDGINPENGLTFDYGFNPFAGKVGFRFANDFSAAFTRDNISTNFTSVSDFKTNMSATIGKDKKNYNDPAIADFNKAKGMLAGSKHVEWFTNQQIQDATKTISGETETAQLARLSNLNGLIPDVLNRQDYFSASGEYGQNAPNNIGAFLATNSSGVSYHYSIPVYNFSEKSVSKSNVQGAYSRTITKPLAYAYTWLLTGITGPDYVDRAPYGQMDENDWGYWVKFEYGKWTDKYIWRNPAEGENKDIDSDVRVSSTGRKELYYLDAIKTRSHTALFIKDIKRDSKGIGSQELGGFNINYNTDGTLQSFPAASLKLNRILLFTNKVLNNQLETSYSNYTISSVAELRTLGDALHHTYIANKPGGGTITVTGHNGKNILDEDDLSKGTDISKMAVRQIVFNYDYSLCPATPNSFDMAYEQGTFTKSPASSGKLTLLSVEVKGLNGKKILPSTDFEYALPATPYNKDAVDIWGNYKSDFTAAETDRKKTQQITTRNSAANIHAWSLSQINTSIGASIKIQYESDQIKKSVLTPFRNFSVSNMQETSTGARIILHTTEDLRNFSEFTANNFINIKALFKAPNVSFVSDPSPVLVYPPEVQTVVDNLVAHKLVDESVKILAVGSNFIDVESALLKNQVKTYTVSHTYEQQTNEGTTYITKSFNINAAFASGNAISAKPTSANEPGGGLRVKTLSVLADNVENITTYNYQDGTTAYDPIDMNLHVDRSPNTGIDDALRNDYRNRVYSNYAALLSNTSFLPPPGVIYKTVIVEDKTKHYSTPNNYIEIPGTGSIKYEFSVFDNTLSPRYDGGSKTMNDGFDLKIVRMRDRRSRVGLLSKITKYSGSSGTGTVLSLQENKYLHDEPGITDYSAEVASRFNNQGKIDQVFFEKKSRIQTAYNSTLTNQFVVTEVEEYPIIALGQKATDYKKGVSSETKTLAFDYYSGEPTITWMKDPYGKEFITQAIPASNVYPGMGHRVNTASNKHMLTQTAASYTFKVQPNKANPKVFSDYNKTGFLAGNAMLWGTSIQVRNADKLNGVGTITQNNIWRELSDYSFTGNDNKALNEDGTHDIADFTPFNHTNIPANSAYWQKSGELLMSNVYSKPIEAKDLNNIYAATLFDPTEKAVIATATNARFKEIAYSGCEFNEYYKTFTDPAKNWYEGNVKPGAGLIVKDKDRSHTGNNCLQVGNNQEGFTYSFTPLPNKKYRASVWLYLPGTAEGAGNDQASNAKIIYRIKGTTAILGEAIRNTDFKARSHYLINLDIDSETIPKVSGAIPEIEIVCISNNADRSIYFDDFRVHPLNAGFISYVYDQDRALLTHILNKDNFYTRYEYDEMGRLVRTFQEIMKVSEKLVGEQKYNYGKSK